MSELKKLLADDVCRNCYHVHPDGDCEQMDLAPGPDGDEWWTCHCTEYVDLEAESHIVVRVTAREGVEA